MDSVRYVIYLVVALALWGPTTSQGQSTPVIIDTFTTPAELTVVVTDGVMQESGPAQSIGMVMIGPPNNRSIEVSRQLSLRITLDYPGAAAIIKSSPLVLLTAPPNNPPAVEGPPRLDLDYRSLSSPVHMDFMNTTGLRVRIRTSTQFKVNAVVFPVDGGSARRWSAGRDVFPGTSVIDIPWGDFMQVPDATPSGEPDLEPILRLVIGFTMTHPEDTPLIIESIELF